MLYLWFTHCTWVINVLQDTNPVPPYSKFSTVTGVIAPRDGRLLLGNGRLSLVQSVSDGEGNGSIWQTLHEAPSFNTGENCDICTVHIEQLIACLKLTILLSRATCGRQMWQVTHWSKCSHRNHSPLYSLHVQTNHIHGENCGPININIKLLLSGHGPLYWGYITRTCSSCWVSRELQLLEVTSW